MKKRFLTAIGAAGFLCLVFGCKTSESQMQEAEKYRLNEGLNGRTMILKKGEGFSLRLRSNPTTGYSWKLSSMDKSILELIENKFIKEENKKQKTVGSGGTDFFFFKAVGAGKTKLKIDYVRPWEKFAKPAKTFNLEVRVEEAD